MGKNKLTIIKGIILTDPISKIEDMVMRAAVTELNSRMPKVINNIRNDISYKLKSVFTNAPEYDSLIGAELGKEFGIPSSDAINKLDKIINVLADDIEVKFTRFSVRGSIIYGGIQVYIIKDDLKSILSLSEGFVKTDKGQDLPWLDWLIVQGDKIIITDYEIKYGNYSNSRAGGAIMSKSSGGIWRVPPQFSGTINDNWITRAIDNASTYLENLINAAIKYNVEKAI